MGHSPSLCIKGNAKSIAFDAQVSTAKAVTENETVEEAEEKFDESSEEEVDDDPEVSALVQKEIGSSATFLLGARSRFGRAVRFNNRLLYGTPLMTTLALIDSRLLQYYEP